MTSLIAHGTIKARFDNETGRRVHQAELISRALDELQVGGHRVWTVEKVLGLLDDVDASVEQTARLVACAVVTAISQGSTGVSLDDRDGASLRAVLDTILETAQRLDEQDRGLEVTAAEVIASYKQAREDGSLSPLVGSPSEYRPLADDRGALYTHQTATMEAAVADKIANMLGDVSGVRMQKARPLVEAVLDAMPFKVEGGERAEKKRVLERVLPKRFGVVSGGAGSGKTTIVLSILRVLDLLAEAEGGLEPGDIALAAPTGKAAKRLWESIEGQVVDVWNEHHDGEHRRLAERLVALRDGLKEPKTLHRLLGYSGYFRTFQRDADSPLDAKLVVVDEASMVDLSLMSALLDALPEGARLLLIGDAGQLPAVQAGAVFHDLSAADQNGHRLSCTAVLEHNFRVKTAKTDGDANGDTNDAQHILEVADDVRSATTETALARLVEQGVVAPNTKVTTEPGVHWIAHRSNDEDHDGVDAFLEKWWQTHYGFLTPPHGTKPSEMPHRSQTAFEHTEDGGFTDEATAKIKRLFDALKSAQLLCITRVLDTGASRLNYRLHKRFASAHGLDGADRFEAGEPVMVTRNDYDADVYNGDQGIVLYTLRPDEKADESQRAKKRVVFADGDGFRAVPFGQLKDKLDYAYALTVHKSQGSEYDHVALVLPELLDVPGADDEKAIHPLMTREILYTGITRAKESVTLFGAQEVFDGGAAKSAGRYSGVRKRLAEREYGAPTVTAADKPVVEALAESSEAQ